MDGKDDGSRLTMKKTILCYGNSNTWGYVPRKANDANLPIERYKKNERWSGILQSSLGNDFEVVEEGLNSRTTNINYKYPPDRNGKTYLPPCLYSHAPIELVILSLGANDLKPEFNRSAADICAGLSELIEIIQSSNYGRGMQQAPRILILSQPIPLPISTNFIDKSESTIFADITKKAKALIPLYANLAKEKGCFFLDVAREIDVSNIDGMHLDKESHKKLAQLITEKIKACLTEQPVMENNNERDYSLRSKL